MRSHEVPGQQAHSTPHVTPAPARNNRGDRGHRAPGALQGTAGNAVVSQMITVSRMMTEDEFKQGTGAITGRRGHSEITKVDQALKAFYALPDAGQGARWLALRDIIRACGDYVAHKGDGGSRVGGTRRLGDQAVAAQGQLDPEAVFRDLLTEIDLAMSKGRTRTTTLVCRPARPRRRPRQSPRTGSTR